jgi:hypothetical protein
MSLRRTSYDVGTMLGALKVPYTVTNVIKNITVQYIIETFGVIVNVMSGADYTIVSDKTTEVFKDYRHVFVSTSDEINEKRYEIIWALMQSGYMKYIRESYGNHFPSLLETDGLGNGIIDERLKRWADKPMYVYLIKDNLEAKNANIRRLLTHDPSFFDYMP